jgi:hypothetical protein
MFIGTLGAIHQNKIKRLLAYSSIAHVGYLLISPATGTIESIEALLIYIVLYTLTVTNIFVTVLLMSRENFNLMEYDRVRTVTYNPEALYIRTLKQTGTYVELQENNDDLETIEDTGSTVGKLPKNLCFSSSGNSSKMAGAEGS